MLFMIGIFNCLGLLFAAINAYWFLFCGVLLLGYYIAVHFIFIPYRWYYAAKHGEITLAAVTHTQPLRNRTGDIYGCIAELNVLGRNAVFADYIREQGYGDKWPCYVVPGDMVVVVIHPRKDKVLVAIGPNLLSLQQPIYDPPLIDVHRIVNGSSVKREVH